jgi:hypothetical protein
MAGALTAAEFRGAAARFPRLSDKGRQVAKSILVDGWTFEQVHQEFGASRQLAHEWATKIYEAFRPTGWITETVTLPPEQMRVVKEMEAAARESWAQALPQRRITRRP